MVGAVHQEPEWPPREDSSYQHFAEEIPHEQLRGDRFHHGHDASHVHSLDKPADWHEASEVADSPFPRYDHQAHPLYEHQGNPYRQGKLYQRPHVQRWHEERHVMHSQSAPPPPAVDANSIQMMMLQQQLMMQQAQIVNQAGGGSTAQMLQLQMLQAQIAAQNCNHGRGSTNVQNCAQQAHQAQKPTRWRPRRAPKGPPIRPVVAVPTIAALPPPLEGQWEGWQEATIILCLVIMAGIYMTVNAAATPAKPTSSSSRPSSSSSSSRSSSSSSKPSSSSTRPK